LGWGVRPTEVGICLSIRWSSSCSPPSGKLSNSEEGVSVVFLLAFLRLLGFFSLCVSPSVLFDACSVRLSRWWDLGSLGIVRNGLQEDTEGAEGSAEGSSDFMQCWVKEWAFVLSNVNLSVSPIFGFWEINAIHTA
ncbi:hypothetical protein Taro_036250, partial [Colocasia esculenta]|nr:hypothetical protein [Colocasia esculenta]